MAPPTLTLYQMNDSLSSRAKLLQKLLWSKEAGLRNPQALYIARQVTRACYARDAICELRAIFQFTVKNVRYTGDMAGVDTFSAPIRTLEMGGEDCFPLSTKIIVRNKVSGQYELRQLEELRETYPLYEAPSYDFAQGIFEFQPIETFIDKGEKEVLSARTSTGSDLIATADHKFWTLTGSRPKEYKLQAQRFGEYQEIWNSNPRTRYLGLRILQAAKIPTLDQEWGNLDEAYLAGIFAAEGYVSHSHVCISQSKRDIQTKIEKALVNCGITWRFQPNRTGTNGGAYYDLHACALKNALREQGQNSFNMGLPMAALSGSPEIVQALIDAYGDGDAYHPKKGSRWDGKVSAIHATSSDTMAEQIRFGMLLLGRSFYVQHQMRHGGVGSRPIWRISEQITPQLLQRESTIQHMLPGMRFGYLSEIKPLGKMHVGCITVAKNHNFLLADGTLVSNCDGHAVLNAALAIANGFRAKFRITSNRGTTWDHIYAMAGTNPKGGTSNWVALDTTLARGRDDISRFGKEPPHAKYQDFLISGPQD